jgi:hypothetical protein
VEKYMVDYIQNLDKYATESATGQYPVTRPIAMERAQEQEGAEAREAGMRKTKTGTTIGPEEEEAEAEAEWGEESRRGAGGGVPSTTTTPVVTVPATIPVTVPATMPLAAEGVGGTRGMGTTAEPQGRE